MIIEKNTNTVVTQLIAKAVLVGIIHPFTNPINRNRCRVLGIILSREEGTRYQKDFNEFGKIRNTLSMLEVNRRMTNYIVRFFACRSEEVNLIIRNKIPTVHVSVNNLLLLPSLTLILTGLESRQDVSWL